MPAGRTSDPLKIIVAHQWQEHPRVQELIAQGHDVVFVLDADFVKAHLILHPAACGWDEELWEDAAYLKAALTQARKRKKGAKA